MARRLPFLRYMMDRSVTLQRNAPTKDSTGAHVSAWSEVTADIEAAIWPADTAKAEDFARRDITIDTAVCTLSDVGAKATDRFYDADAGAYYVVKGKEPFANAGVMPHGIHVYHCERRTV